MGSISAGVPLDLAVCLRDQLGLETAVETGTYRGDSAALLAEHFGRVWTVELSEPLWRVASERHASVRNIEFVHGPSEEVLGRIAAALAAPALYWLDGHWSGDVTAGEENECPVLAEIDAIDASKTADRSPILIDDARFFAAPPPAPHRREQWPPLMEVFDALRKHEDRYVTVLEDVIIAVPASARRTVEDWGTGRQFELQRDPFWHRATRRLISALGRR